jgi:hypothetical protein
MVHHELSEYKIGTDIIQRLEEILKP